MIEFAGKHIATVDDKGRVVLPSSFKKELGELADQYLVLEKNLHKNCLDIHPEKYWRERVAEFKSTLDPFDEEDDALLQFFYQNFIKVSMANNGRVNIPVEYSEYAKLEKNVEFIGMGEFIRLLPVREHRQGEMSRDEFLEKLKQKRKKKAEGK